MPRTYTKEFYYEFPLTHFQVRLWSTIELSVQSWHSLKEKLNQRWMEGELRGAEFCDWIAENIEFLAAVQILNQKSGYGSIVYIDWP